MDKIYLNLYENTEIIGTKKVLLKDVAEVYGKKRIVEKCDNIEVFTIPKEESKEDHYAISAFDIIKKMNDINNGEDILIVNIGEKNVVISYFGKEKNNSKIWIGIKVIFVCLILFFGGSIAIMTFQTDAALPTVFNQLYYILLGNTNYKPYLLEIPYAIGILFGITVFFNHIFKVKLTKDPTPIEVEMRSYETEVNKCIIKNSNVAKGKKNG